MEASRNFAPGREGFPGPAVHSDPGTDRAPSASGYPADADCGWREPSTAASRADVGQWRRNRETWRRSAPFTPRHERCIMTLPAELTADADPAAGFECQVAPLLGDLHRHALRMTRQHADAEDLVQDTLAKAFAGFDSFRPDSNIHAWLYRIMVNTHISNCRKTQRRPAHAFGAARHRICNWWSAPPIRPWVCPRRRIRR